MCGSIYFHKLNTPMLKHQLKKEKSPESQYPPLRPPPTSTPSQRTTSIMTSCTWIRFAAFCALQRWNHPACMLLCLAYFANMMFVRSGHTCRWSNFIGLRCPMWILHDFWIRSIVGRLCCSYILTITNNAATNLLVCMFWWPSCLRSCWVYSFASNCWVIDST